MLNPALPKHVTLYFAVFDGRDPANWQPYRRRFSDLLADARKAGNEALRHVPDKTVELEFDVLLVDPGHLLTTDKLHCLVGVIIDAAACDNPTAAKSQLDLLRNLCAKQRIWGDMGNAELLCRQFGFEIWLVIPEGTNPLPIKLAIEAEEIVRLRLTEVCRHDFIVDDISLKDSTVSYLSNRLTNAMLSRSK